jgi:hypothetical protein
VKRSDYQQEAFHSLILRVKSGIIFGKGDTVKEEKVPSEIFLYSWRITCLFPKPESTKNMKLTVLGRQMKMDYP